jgi:hypothetical protein
MSRHCCREINENGSAKGDENSRRGDSTRSRELVHKQC